MKKIIALTLALCMMLTLFTACNPTGQSTNTSSGDDVIDIPSDIPSDEPIVDEPLVDEPIDEPIYDEPIYDEPIEDEPIKDEPIKDKPSGDDPIVLRANAIQTGDDQKFLDSALLKDSTGKVQGNMTRFANFLKKLEKGEKVTMYSYGGQNAGYDDEMLEENYIVKFKNWVDSYSKGSSVAYSAGIGSLTSTEAIYRVKRDIIDRDPDLVVLDFAVEDAFQGKAKNRAPYFENMVRRLLSETDAAIIILCNPAADASSFTGNKSKPAIFTTAAKYHKEVAEFYDIPVIDFESAVYNAITEFVVKKPYSEQSLLDWLTFAEEQILLNVTSHNNISAILARYCTLVKEEMDKGTARTKNDIKLGSNSNNKTYKYGVNNYMNYDFLYFTDALNAGNKGLYGYKIKAIRPHTIWGEWQLEESTQYLCQNYISGVLALTVEARNAQKTNKELVDGDAEPLVIHVPKVTVSNKQYLMFSCQTTVWPRAGSGQGGGVPWTCYRVTFYDGNGKVIKKPIRPFRVKHYDEVTEQFYYDSHMPPIELYEGTEKVTIEVASSSGHICYYGIGTQKPLS